MTGATARPDERDRCFRCSGVLYAIDTASQNGSWCGEKPVRATRLHSGLRVSLAGKATVEWRPFH